MMHRREIKTRLTIYRKRKQIQETNLLKSDYRNLARIAEADHLPKSMGSAFKVIALPQDYDKIIHHLDSCCPKTRRMADRALDFWEKMGSGKFMYILKTTFFNSSGSLKPTPIELLFCEFHDALLKESQEMKKSGSMARHWEGTKPPIRVQRPSVVTPREARIKVAHYRSKMREIETSSLKRDFLALSKICHLDSEVSPENVKETLELLSLPQDFRKVVDYLGTCTPKTRRIARKCISMWAAIDSREYLALLRESFFNPDLTLKKEPLDHMFAIFHSKLLEKSHEIKEEMKSWIPWDRVKKKMRLT